MSAELIRRSGWVASVVSLLLWAVTTLSLAYRVFVVGLSADQQRVVAEFSYQPLETLTKPLVLLLLSAIVLGIVTVLSLLYYGYTQWRYAHYRRLALESEN